MCNGGHAALARRPSLESGVLEDEGEMTEADRKADVCWLAGCWWWWSGVPHGPQVGKNCML